MVEVQKRKEIVLIDTGGVNPLPMGRGEGEEHQNERDRLQKEEKTQGVRKRDRNVLLC